MKLEGIKNRVNELLTLSDEVIKTSWSDSWNSWVSDRLFSEFRSSSLSYLKNTFGIDHPVYIDFLNKVSKATPDDTNKGIGIIKAAKQEIEGGWLFTIKGIVSAEIFSDQLEMAYYLLDENYKDPAAVLIGCVLEEHLRQLSKKHNISTVREKDGKPFPKKADLLNSELASANVYNKLDQKSITSWLDLRNKAAHGNFGDYSKEQVEIVYQGVANFISRTT